MHYFLYVRIPEFYVREWVRREPGRASEPIAVHRDKRLIDLNARAREFGLRREMGLDEAKALLQGKGLIAWEEEPYREAQARWLDLLAEFSCTIEPDRQDSAWADLAGHPDPYLAAGEARAALGDCSLGIAGTKWIAKLACEHFGELPPAAWDLAMRECLETPAEFLAPFPIQFLAPAEAAHRERLWFLGYRTIGEAANVPMGTMRAQFGNAAHTILAAANGSFAEAVLPRYPHDSLAAAMRFEGGLNDAEELGRAMAALAKRLAAALSGRDAQSAKIDATVELEETALMRRRTFSRPMRTLRETMAGLRLTVGEVGQPVYGLLVRMLDLEKAKPRQVSLYVAQAPDAVASASATVESLRKVFGDGSILRASERKEPRRVRVLRAWSHATGWK